MNTKQAPIWYSDELQTFVRVAYWLLGAYAFNQWVVIVLGLIRLLRG